MGGPVIRVRRLESEPVTAHLEADTSGRSGPHVLDQGRQSSRTLGIALALVAATVFGFAASKIALRLPQYFELDYGEGFVWSEVSNLLAGRIYAPLGEYPHAIMHYTPLYHAGVAVLWRLGLDPLLAGRAISLGAGAALVWAVALLAIGGLPGESGRGKRLVAGIAAASVIAAMPEVIEWSSLMRVDMLAVSLGTLGLAALQRHERGPIWLWLAGALFLAALLAKQNAVAPLVAGMGALAAVRPGTGLRLATVLAAIGVALVLAAEWATAGEFLRHTVLYNAARFRWDHVTQLWLPLALKAAVPVALGAGYAAMKLRQLWRRGRQDRMAWTPLALGMNLAVGIALSLGAAKEGAGPNYMLPLLPAAAALTGLALAEASRRAPVLLALLAASLLAGLVNYPFPSTAELAKHEREDAALLEIVRATPGPVLSEDMTVLMRAGRPVPWEFGSITELSALGLFDEAPLVRRFEEQYFDTLIVYTWEPQRFTEAIRSAAQQHYERVASVGEFEIWRRRGTAQKVRVRADRRRRPASGDEAPLPIIQR